MNDDPIERQNDLEKKSQLIQQGKLKEDIQMNIDDVKRIAATTGNPHKYDCALQEMQAYADSLDSDDFRPPASANSTGNSTLTSKSSSKPSKPKKKGK